MGRDAGTAFYTSRIWVAWSHREREGEGDQLGYSPRSILFVGVRVGVRVGGDGLLLAPPFAIHLFTVVERSFFLCYIHRL